MMYLRRTIKLISQSVRNIAREPIYPLLFALFPALYLFQHNAEELKLGVVVEPLLFSVVLACALLLLLYPIYRSWERAGLVAMAGLVVFFVYQPLVLLLPDTLSIGTASIGRGKVVLPLSISALLIISWLVWRAKRKSFPQLTKSLNVFASILLILVVWQVGTVSVNRMMRQANWATASANTEDSTAEVTAKPDIYYFIFDRYAGEQTLANDYDFDNRAFLQSLDDKGFYVAADSHTNYPSTELSISSTLSMAYHQPYDGTGPHPDFQTDVYPKIWNAEVAKELKSIGYHYYQVASRYMPTSYSNVADRLYTVKPQSALHIDEFSTQFLQTTLLNVVAPDSLKKVVDLDFNGAFLNAHQVQQERVPLVVQLDGPKFVFTHVLLPHDPYVVNSQCQPIPVEKRMRETDLPAYLDQLQCANRLAETWVNQILQQTDGQAIIILQGDEGPYPLVHLLPQQKNFSHASLPAIQERTRILNAYYFPDKDYSQLYVNITPVNSFRTILRQYFGMDLDNLEDKTFVFPSEEDIFEFIDATEKLAAPKT